MSTLARGFTIANDGYPSEELCRRFSLAEIQTATNSFDDALVIGKGGFGIVYKGVISDGATAVAIKCWHAHSKQGAGEFWTEIKTLSNLRHPHLVTLIGYLSEGKEMALVYKYMVNGTLADHLYQTSTKRNGDDIYHLTWEQRLKICIDAARGLDYLHTEHGVIHRDVKTTNILLDENRIAKISDFGLSRMGTTSLTQTHVSTNVKGTFGYLDPNYFLTCRLTKKSDVYAFGVVLFEVLCARPPLDITAEEEEQRSLVLWAQHCIKKGTLDQIIDPSLRGQIPAHGLKVFAEVANRCLQSHPKARPTMAEVVGSLTLAFNSQGDLPQPKGTITKKCATMKGCYLGEERSVEVISLSTDDGGEIVGPIALSSSDFASTHNKARFVREDQRGSTASHSKKKNTREASNSKRISTSSFSLEDIQRHFGTKREDAAKILGVSVSSLKRIRQRYGIPRWPNRIRNDVLKPPDPQGEKNASPTCKTPSANRQTALENEGVGQHQVPNEFLPDSIGGPNSWNSENGLLEDVNRTLTLHDSCTDNYPDMIPLHIPPIFKERGEAGGSSEWGLQWRDLTYTNADTLEFPLPQMASSLMVSESMRISEDWRHPQMASTQMVSVSMGISEDWSQPPIASTQMVSENMEISQDWINLLASPTEAFQEVNVSGSSNWTVPTSFDPALSQPTRSIPHTMPIIPSMLPISPRIMPTITHMTSHLTAKENVSYVTLKPKYGRSIMKFQFPTRSGINELKEEVSKRLKLGLGSFDVEYTDEDGDDVLIGCDEDLRHCLQHFSPLGTQAIRLLVIDKDPIATNL